jgi:hypothetical protein
MEFVAAPNLPPSNWAKSKVEPLCEIPIAVDEREALDVKKQIQPDSRDYLRGHCLPSQDCCRAADTYQRDATRVAVGSSAARRFDSNRPTFRSSPQSRGVAQSSASAACEAGSVACRFASAVHESVFAAV